MKNNIKNLASRIPGIKEAYLMISGILSIFIPHFRRGKHVGGSVSARYCYSVWMRHLSYLKKCGMEKMPKAVAELGPGDSLGIGLCALLCGASQYYAFDIVKDANSEYNLQIFEELLLMLKKREPIPDDKEFPLITLKLDNYSFPSHILSDDLLARTLAEERVGG